MSWASTSWSDQNLGYHDDTYEQIKETCSQCGGWAPSDSDLVDGELGDRLCPKCNLGPQYEAEEKAFSDRVNAYNASQGLDLPAR